MENDSVINDFVGGGFRIRCLL